MSDTVSTIAIRHAQDVVVTRQQARKIAELLGYDSMDQTRLATAVSEIARNAYQHGAIGSVEFAVVTATPPKLQITVRDHGPGISDLKAVLDGQHAPSSGQPQGMGILSARRLADEFHIDSAAGRGTTVKFAKLLPRGVKPSNARLVQIQQELSQMDLQSPLEEINRQNKEMADALDQLRTHEIELNRLNRELAETNRGVMALYAEIDERAGYHERVSDLKSSFLSNMSHEFRTPLSSIVSLSRILLDRLDGDLTQEQETQVTLIRDSAQSLGELVNDLLDLAKIEAGKTVVRAAPFTMPDVLNALRGMFRAIVPHGAVELVVEDSVDIPDLHTDEAKVAQILRNLISNALKFTPSGEVRVSSKMTDPNTLSLSVSDTGIGIEPGNHERIFDEFVQIEGTVHTAKGTGLGLPLSRKLARLLGGDLTVESTPGVGARFILTLPVQYAEQPSQ